MKFVKPKEVVLKSVREALIKPTERPASRPDFPTPIYADRSEEDLSVLFVENFLKAKGKFFFCEDEEYFLRQYRQFAEAAGIKEVFIFEEKPAKLVSSVSPSVVRDDARLSSIQAAVTSCECLVARTGSIVVSSAQRCGRSLTVYTPLHMVTAYTSQIVLEIKDALVHLKSKYEDGLPSMISFVTGPARTADIEKTLVLGAHGPGELILFLINDLDD